MRALRHANVGEWWMRAGDASRGRPAQLRLVLEVDPVKGAWMADAENLVFHPECGTLEDWTLGRRTRVSPETLGQESKYTLVDRPFVIVPEAVAPAAPDLSTMPMCEMVAALLAPLAAKLDAALAEIAALRAERGRPVQQTLFQVAG